MTLSSKDKILERLKNNKTRDEGNMPSSGFSFLKTAEVPLIQLFEEKLKKVNGEFIYCSSESEMQIRLKQYIESNSLNHIVCLEENIQNKLKDIHWEAKITPDIGAAITGCEFLVAQTGSVLVSTAQTKSRRTFSYPPVHIIIAYRDQLVGQLEEGLNHLAKKYKNRLPSQITSITGPSRTADIEKTLVLGAHGPKANIIFYIDDDF